MIPGKGGKKFTLENLIADEACKPGLEVVTPIIERGGDVALELRSAGHLGYISWAVRRGYDCSSAWKDMDAAGNSFTWHDDGWIFATAGYCGTAKAGYKGTATAGDYGTATAGYKGTAAAGDYGTATAGYKGTATAGDGGTATAGESGTATAGDYGIATVAEEGKASAGIGGVVCIQFYDGENYRIRCAEVDGVTIKPNTLYKLNRDGEFVEGS